MGWGAGVCRQPGGGGVCSWLAVKEGRWGGGSLQQAGSGGGGD